MWKIAYILPNIIITTGIETENLALVPYEGERIEVIKEEQKGASKLLDGFVDDFNTLVKPAVLIVKISSPENLLSIDSIVVFRNIIALATILPNWALDYSLGSVLGPLFSNSFDFYPVILTTEGYIITDNPSKLNLGSTEAPFFATPSRESARVNIGLQDPMLFKPLLKLWKDKYELNKEESYLFRKIFRSLEIAYFALSIPTKNESSIYDYGLSISLWISAIETLVKRPRKNIGKMTVISLLKNHGFNDLKLSNPKFNFRSKSLNPEINFLL